MPWPQKDRLLLPSPSVLRSPSSIVCEGLMRMPARTMPSTAFSLLLVRTMATPVLLLDSDSDSESAEATTSPSSSKPSFSYSSSPPRVGTSAVAPAAAISAAIVTAAAAELSEETVADMLCLPDIPDMLCFPDTPEANGEVRPSARYMGLLGSAGVIPPSLPPHRTGFSLLLLFMLSWLHPLLLRVLEVGEDIGGSSSTRKGRAMFSGVRVKLLRVGLLLRALVPGDMEGSASVMALIRSHCAEACLVILPPD
mmetsp:Transcript_20805/g.46331  ORF Transcript_20805/g.46331 Transcript_20805/m.46331 type:complete len:253 (+) Transcript_20805:987-1745(+)